MTFEEAKKIFLNRGYIEVSGGTYYDVDKWRESITVISKWLEQEACEDCISRQAVLNGVDRYIYKSQSTGTQDDFYSFAELVVKDLSPVMPKEKTGEWLRMSVLSEQEDDRYKCSCCGNVVHHKDKMNLYTFNSWCGRCGSNNERQREVT